MVRCFHRWAYEGSVSTGNGYRIVLWRCESCGKERETFADCEPPEFSGLPCIRPPSTASGRTPSGGPAS